MTIRVLCDASEHRAPFEGRLDIVTDGEGQLRLRPVGTWRLVEVRRTGEGGVEAECFLACSEGCEAAVLRRLGNRDGRPAGRADGQQGT